MFLPRLCRKLTVLLCVLFLPCTAWSQGPPWKIVHGDVLQVDSEAHTLLLSCDGQKIELPIAEDCQVFREGQPVALGSMRPVGPEAYQDVLCWVNPQGLVSMILVNYYVQEEDGLLVAYDIFGNPK